MGIGAGRGPVGARAGGGGQVAYRQAVVVVHGMGEQKPLAALRGFVGAVLSQYGPDNRVYYSRPSPVSNSYEARRYIIPPIYDEASPDRRPQTEVFEYHWAHLMQGNRLDDLADTGRRILFRWPWNVPGGILGLWLVLWAGIAGSGVLVFSLVRSGQLSGVPDAATIVGIVLGTGALGAAVTFVVTRLLPRWLTGSFVDVVRYLDTSPRSYAVRRDIRSGAVEVLSELNDRYDRVVVVGHSLGSYIAYDAIRYLWAQRRHDYADAVERGRETPRTPAGLDELEAAATALLDESGANGPELADYRTAQRALWHGLRDESHRWTITDLVTLGSPMYMADQIYTRDRQEFEERVRRHEFPTCPPQDDFPSWREGKEPARARRYSYVYRGRRVLYDAAPFAVIRWTNLWFPTRALFFGDWFGGPLAPLFGAGVADVPIRSGSRWRHAPGKAHAMYFSEIAASPDGPLAVSFHDALRR